MVVLDSFFYLGDKKVVTGCVSQVFVLYSNGCVGICLDGLSIGRHRRVVVELKFSQSEMFIYQCTEKPLHCKDLFKYLLLLSNLMNRPGQNLDTYKLLQAAETFIYFYVKVCKWFAIAWYTYGVFDTLHWLMSWNIMFWLNVL